VRRHFSAKQHSQAGEGKWHCLLAAVCWLVGTPLSCVFRVVKLMNWKHENVPGWHEILQKEQESFAAVW